ncbi:zinc metallopeptidase [Agrilactobacillus yilanensis]|uniref:Zinc metallopeptidase n=1 Tax=Agrilactobacillus yilanensis TaxID=2485997 RepID=A0ABW4J6I6_9LACO|nr:zinc metallopeptidase [Agrilactobacillus yilanensis]
MMYFDPTFMLVILGLLLSGIASAHVNRTFNEYDQVSSRHGTTATEAAQFILNQAGIHDVQIQEISGHLTDNYNSQDKTLNLSESTAQSTSIAAIGVAAHEVGHAIQDHTNYGPLRIRASLVPITNIGTSISFPLILVGVLLSWNQTLIHLGILAFSLALVFQLVTLPVEFNASMRAINTLSNSPLLDNDEIPIVKRVLSAAALTYVAAALATFLQLLRLILLFGRNRE